MIATWRLALKIQRFEVLASALLALVLAVAAVVVRWRLDDVGVSQACWDVWFSAAPAGGDACTELASRFLEIDNNEAALVFGAIEVAPMVVGLFIGVPLVAREIESGTAPTVWALARSRARWLVGRLIPVVAVLLVVLGILALATEFLWSGREPWGPPISFRDATAHGPVLVAKGLAALGLAVVAGAAMGRILPAIIVAALLIVVLHVGGKAAYRVWLQNEAPQHVVVIDPNHGLTEDEAFPGGTNVITGWASADGAFLDGRQAAALVPPGTDDPDQWLVDNLRGAMQGVPGDRYPTWSILETLGVGLVAVVALGLAFIVVNRRRPL